MAEKPVSLMVRTVPGRRSLSHAARLCKNSVLGFAAITSRTPGFFGVLEKNWMLVGSPCMETRRVKKYGFVTER